MRYCSYSEKLFSYTKIILIFGGCIEFQQFEDPLICNNLFFFTDQSAVVYLLLKFVVDWVDGQISYLEAHETAAVVNFCMNLLQLYASHNIGKVLFPSFLSTVVFKT